MKRKPKPLSFLEMLAVIVRYFRQQARIEKREAKHAAFPFCGKRQIARYTRQGK
jgi:hypothetical protein